MPKIDKEDIKKDIEKYAELEALSNIKGGQQLISYLEEDLIGSIDELIGKYKQVPVNELLPIIASIDKGLNLLRAIKRAATNKQLALDALKEEEKREKEA